MRKIICFATALAITLLLAACGGQPAGEESVVKKTTQQYDGFKPKTAGIKKADSYTEEGISVSVTDISYEDVVTKIVFRMKNETDAPVRVGTANFSINGFMCTDGLFCEVLANSEETSALEISNEWFGKMQIEVIEDMEFVVKVYDVDNNEIKQSDILKVKTNAPFTYRQKYDDSGFEIYNGNGVKISARLLQKSEHSNDLELVFYAENNTGSAISVMSYDVLVNEIPVEPLFVISVGAGKKAVDTMVFYEKDLKQNNIEHFEKVTARFKAFNEGLETIFDTDPVNIPIEQ